jgi:hypothetical protein
MILADVMDALHNCFPSSPFFDGITQIPLTPTTTLPIYAVLGSVSHAS